MFRDLAAGVISNTKGLDRQSRYSVCIAFSIWQGIIWITFSYYLSANYRHGVGKIQALNYVALKNSH